MVLLIEEMSKLDNAKLSDIIDFIKLNHKGKRRKFGEKEAYYNHPVRVFTKIYNLTDDFNLAAAALLHDTLEDTDVTEGTLEDYFGTAIANLVKELTNDKNEIDALGKTKYIINKMNKISDNALTIKLIDRLDNVSDFSIAPVKWVTKYIDQTYSILAGVKGRNSLQKHLMKLIYDKIEPFEYLLEN